MPLIASNAEKFRELDADTRRAWSAYSERVRRLDGMEYERVEDQSWGELQSELCRLERRRQSLKQTSR
ncbi:MAG: hypothetical protein ACR2QA_10585 [Solirubrobacteraceae bacterium]